ncbi:RadC family protein [Chryseobacterium sp. TY3]
MKVSEIQINYYPSILDNAKITNSQSAVTLIKNHWNLGTLELHEEVKIVLLNLGNYVLGIHHLSKGGITGSIVDTRLILSIALKTLATGIILVHNHPSGNTNPSKADKDITTKLKSCCDIMNIKLLDHLIVTKESYFSFADEGLL